MNIIEKKRGVKPCFYLGKLISKISKIEYFWQRGERSFGGIKLLFMGAVIFIGFLLLGKDFIFSRAYGYQEDVSIFSSQVSLSSEDYQQEDNKALIEEGVVSELEEGSLSCVNNQGVVASLEDKDKNSETQNASSQEIKRKATEYIVQPGDTLSVIAEKFGIKTQTILWANNLDYLSVIKPGDKLTIPPEDGVLYTVKAGDTLLDIAVRYKADLDKIVAFNQLDANYIVEGQVLFIPDGIKPAPQPATTYLASVNTSASSYSSSSSSSSLSYNSSRSASSYTPTIRYGGGGNRFPYGYCTWYVAQRRGGVPWSGNAGAWLENARAAGYATGSEPVPGAIMVTRESWWGHVAYVESISGNMVTISEMNYQGYGIVSRRTLNKNDWRIRGYIY